MRAFSEYHPTVLTAYFLSVLLIAMFTSNPVMACSALLGGVLLGIIEIFSKAYISQELSNAIVFAVLIIILLVKPNGLLGKKVREKV